MLINNDNIEEIMGLKSMSILVIKLSKTYNKYSTFNLSAKLEIGSFYMSMHVEDVINGYAIRASSLNASLSRDKDIRIINALLTHTDNPSVQPMYEEDVEASYPGIWECIRETSLLRNGKGLYIIPILLLNTLDSLSHRKLSVTRIETLNNYKRELAALDENFLTIKDLPIREKTDFEKVKDIIDNKDKYIITLIYDIKTHAPDDAVDVLLEELFLTDLSDEEKIEVEKMILEEEK